MNTMKEKFSELLNFRSLMGLSLSKENVRYIWGRKGMRTLNVENLKYLKENKNSCSEEKIFLAKNFLSRLLIFNWVKFVGVSGSVAAGFTKDEDDIDIFVVVQNNTSWIYRGIIVFLNLFHNKLRSKRSKNLKNKFCVNLLCEERGLEFEPDIFNFHELMFLIPIYNLEYLNYIYSQNQWLREEFHVKREIFKTKVKFQKKTFFLVKIVNYFAFLSQLLFMIFTKHSPDIVRLQRDYKKGRIEFFKDSFKRDILENYSKEFKSIN